MQILHSENMLSLSDNKKNIQNMLKPQGANTTCFLADYVPHSPEPQLKWISSVEILYLLLSKSYICSSHDNADFRCSPKPFDFGTEDIGIHQASVL